MFRSYNLNFLAHNPTGQNRGGGGMCHGSDKRFGFPASEIARKLRHACQHSATIQIEHSYTAPQLAAHVAPSSAYDQVNFDAPVVQSMGKVDEDALHSPNLQGRHQQCDPHFSSSSPFFSRLRRAMAASRSRVAASILLSAPAV